MITLNTIIDAFEDFSASHSQINTFSADQTYNFQSRTNIYPAVILVPASSTISDGKLKFVFQIFVLDKLNKDRSNTNEVLSDTSLIMADIIAEFDDNYDTYGFMLDDPDISIDPIVEEFDDVLAGWVATNFSIQIPYGRNDCVIPKN